MQSQKYCTKDGLIIFALLYKFWIMIIVSENTPIFAQKGRFYQKKDHLQMLNTSGKVIVLNIVF